MKSQTTVRRRAMGWIVASVLIAPTFVPASDPGARPGGAPGRNMVSPAVGLAQRWDLLKRENSRWVAELGTETYGGPVVAGGKVFVGTNNAKPRDPAVTGDRGVLMVFRAEDPLHGGLAKPGVEIRGVRPQ